MLAVLNFYVVTSGIFYYDGAWKMQEKHYTLVRVGIVNGQPIWVTSDFPEFDNVPDSEVITECFDCHLNILRDKTGAIIGFGVTGIIPKEAQ